MDEKDKTVTLTIKELCRIQDLIERVTGKFDFDLQDEDYQKEMNDLELKIFQALTKN